MMPLSGSNRTHTKTPYSSGKLGYGERFQQILGGNNCSPTEMNLIMPLSIEKPYDQTIVISSIELPLDEVVYHPIKWAVSI
jgi:hypothetical protein